MDNHGNGLLNFFYYFFFSPCDNFCLILHIIIGLTKILCAVLHPCLISILCTTTTRLSGALHENNLWYQLRIYWRSNTCPFQHHRHLPAVAVAASTPTGVVSHDVVALMWLALLCFGVVQRSRREEGRSTRDEGRSHREEVKGRGVIDDEEGHLVYRPGDVLQARCTVSNAP